MLAIHGGQGYRPREHILTVRPASRAYLVLVAIAAALMLFGIWWGGQLVLLGIGLGWVTGLLLWAVRKDLISEFHTLFW